MKANTSTDTEDSKGEAETEDSGNQDLVEEVTTEVMKNITRKWANEKEAFQDMEYVVQRNAALRWLRQNKKGSGIVYFMDEFKIYSLEVFSEVSKPRVHELVDISNSTYLLLCRCVPSRK